QLAVDASPATTDIIDTTDTTTVSLGATGQITEAGGTVTYTATVDNAPASDLEITLSNGETITIEAGETSGDVDVSVSADDVTDVSSLSVTISDTSGGGYEQLAVSATSATTEVIELNEAPVAVDDTGSGSAGDVLVSEDFSGGVSGWGDEVSARGGRMEIGKDETASKTFDFGSEHAGETVTVSFDSQTKGSWDERGRLQDVFTVDANGNEVINTSERGSESHTFQATLDENGQLTLELHTDATGRDEGMRIDNLQVVAGEDWSGAATAVETSTITIDVLANDTDADGDTLTITDVSEVIDADGNVIGTAEVVDGKVEFTANAEYEGLTDGESVEGSFTYTISDGKGGTDTATVSVAVQGENDAVTDIVVTGTAVTEGAEAGTVVSTLDAVDPDTGETFTYEIVGDSSLFEIVGNQVVVKEGADIDFESAESHDLTLQVTDSGGNSHQETVTINVSDVEEAVTQTASSSEGQAIVLNESGNNDGLRIEDGGELLAGQEELTITLNVKFDGDGLEDTTPLISYATSENNNEFRIELKPRGGDKFEFHVDSAGDAEETGGRDRLDADLLFDGEFHEVTVSISANGDLSYQIDGEEVATDNFERGHVINASRDDGVLIIGQEQDRVGSRFDDDEVFKGQISDVKIYHTDDVSEDSEPAAHWDMSSLENGVIPDLVGDHDMSVISIDERGFEAGSEPYLVNIGGADETTETAGDEAPTDISFSGTTVEEGAAAGTVVATLQTIDQSTGDTFSYELVRDDSGHFEIVDDKLVVKEGADIDYESETVHELSIQVTDSTGNTYSETVSIRVDDVQEVMSATHEGTRRNDHIDGDDGNDVIDGMRGNDHLDGGEGHDVLLGGKGNDHLEGGEGHDRLEGGKGNDKLEGEEGNDYLVGGKGNDDMRGGEGDDTFIAGAGNDQMRGGEGDDRFVAGEGNDRAEGGEGNDLFEADPFGGSDYFSGGEGGGWTDVIQLNADGVPAGSDPDTPWTIEVDGEQVQYDIADHALSLDPDASGVITFSDGSELTFDGVERIEW
ncbi:MAG: immunoglobulin-like domain-containing protein, partial [Sedimenticola sp.]